MAGLEFLGAALTNIGAPILGGLVRQIIPGDGPIDAMAGELVDGLVKNLAVAMGVPPTPEAVAEAVQADPVAGKAAADRVLVEQQAAAAQLMEIQARAQIHARDTTVALVREHSLLAWGPTAYSTCIVFMFAYVLHLFMTKPMSISEAAGGILTMLLGVLTREMGAVGGYFLGSTQASKDKDSTISHIVKQASTPSAGQMAGKAVDAVIAATKKK